VTSGRYGSFVSRLETIEHRQGRLGTVLRRRRAQLILWIVLVEGILVLVDVIPWWSVLLLAAVTFLAYVSSGRKHSSQLVREASWVAAVSQLVVVLVPVLAVILTTLAIVALVIVAGAVLVLLLLDRR
jgi:hypothetical protein